MRRISLILGIFLLPYCVLAQEQKCDWEGGVPEGCTTITVGRKASDDGSVMTSHTDDSHRTRSSINIVPAKDHAKGVMMPMYKRGPDNTKAMPAYANTKIGEIPQIAHTYRFINTAYPCMNEHQLAIGESTFGGREVLKSDSGLIDCQRLVQLMLERCKTAREAIKLADELTGKYGWIDDGECLTIADKTEVWHFEIVGPGRGKLGAIWAAQRVPDDHIACNANASTIKEINLKKKDYFMASSNVYDLALEEGWAKSKQDFRFCYAYAPESRKSVASRRREWRIFDMVAPSLKLDPNDENYPFSVKPDMPVSKEKMIEIFKDYYEGTPYDMTREMLVSDGKGGMKISPLANPFLPYDQLSINKVNGGWYSIDEKTGEISFLGERTIARWYTMYATITQSRNWLPDEIGGVVWLAQDNVATSIYIPIYPHVIDLPESYKVDGRETGFSMKSAWWVFNRLGTLAAQRWGDMRHDVDAVWKPLQNQMLTQQDGFEKEVMNLLIVGKRDEAIKKITDYTQMWGNKVVDEAIKLGDWLWTNYDEKF